MIKQVVYRRTNITIVSSIAPSGYVYNNWNYDNDNYNSVSSSNCSFNKQCDINPTEK